MRSDGKELLWDQAVRGGILGERQGSTPGQVGANCYASKTNTWFLVILRPWRLDLVNS
jgi:hypothetical protein